jgi:hypothetical protein
MLKNSCEFLDTASIYTKYHEYQFESPNYIISCTCNANLKYAKNSTKRKKAFEIYQKNQNYPKFERGVSNNVEWPRGIDCSTSVRHKALEKGPTGPTQSNSNWATRPIY